jgi:hypothetical protein
VNSKFIHVDLKEKIYMRKHNGVVEQMNRTFMERDRNMLNGVGLEDKF